MTELLKTTRVSRNPFKGSPRQTAPCLPPPAPVEQKFARKHICLIFGGGEGVQGGHGLGHGLGRGDDVGGNGRRTPLLRLRLCNKGSALRPSRLALGLASAWRGGAPDWALSAGRGTG